LALASAIALDSGLDDEEEAIPISAATRPPVVFIRGREEGLRRCGDGVVGWL